MVLGCDQVQMKLTQLDVEHNEVSEPKNTRNDGVHGLQTA